MTRRSPPEFRLIPAEQPLAGQVEADWQLYNGTMSAGTAIFAYYHLLPERKLMAPVFAAPTSWWERLIMPVFYPLMRKMIAAKLKLSPEAAEVAYGQILSSFAETDARVADGRLYLNGDRMTLGDIALAAAAAPLILPQGYDTPMPTLEQMPPADADPGHRIARPPDRGLRPALLFGRAAGGARQARRGTGRLGAHFSRRARASAAAGLRTLAPLMKKAKVSRGVTWALASLT